MSESSEVCSSPIWLVMRLWDLAFWDLVIGLTCFGGSLNIQSLSLLLISSEGIGGHLVLFPGYSLTSLGSSKLLSLISSMQPSGICTRCAVTFLIYFGVAPPFSNCFHNLSLQLINIQKWFSSTSTPWIVMTVWIDFDKFRWKVLYDSVIPRCNTTWRFKLGAYNIRSCRGVLNSRIPLTGVSFTWD